MANKTITIPGNDFVADKTLIALQQLATNLDLETIEILAKLSKNQKAISMLKKPSSLMFLGIK